MTVELHNFCMVHNKILFLQLKSIFSRIFFVINLPEIDVVNIELCNKLTTKLTGVN